ncbi:hypothetical protein NKR23_g11924 [Pleurostoma richardsiae]|uniref:Alpha/beta hydrolase fold-3 domain-containing protein n=1 Tax=Pleurostoma richardsiae TaxID=41990 RepID=A0AA38R8Z8_9PEZI|nr:hypothetical protein NKR23_g11924 [Pleurostoma richardsiae]
MAALIEDPSKWNTLIKDDEELLQMLQNGITPRFQRLDNDFETIRETWVPTAKAMADEALLAANGTVTALEIQVPIDETGGTYRTLLYQPTVKDADGLPLVIVFHGGGFCLGSAEMESPVLIEATKRHGCVTMTVDYRLAPEYQYPTPFIDSWNLIKWVHAHASDFGANISKGFILGGCSAGGTLASYLIQMARPFQPGL